MLVARRDPPLQSGAYEHLRTHGHGHAHSFPFITALQVVGSLLAIPVGLASAYSIYHTNFTAEAHCQTLRSNIISMLDKSADASTLRMLVRRDVVMFETNCGSVDPDAVKAFKALLLTANAAPLTPADALPHELARQQVEVVKQVVAPKAEPAPVTAVEAKPAHRDAATSDANWIASVREALVHTPAPHEEAVAPPAELQSQRAETKVVPTVEPNDVQLALSPQPRVVHEAPPMSLAAPAAPALPAPVAVAAAPAPMFAADHPVPPGSIPEAQTEKPANKSHSWMSEVPILNRVVGK